MNNNNEFFGWDDEIAFDEPEFITLVPGKYVASIYKVERKRKNSGKFNGSLYAEISLAVEDGTGQTAFIKDELLLVRSMEFRIRNFLRAVGAIEATGEGEPIRASLISQAVGRNVFVTIGCQKKNSSTGKYDDLTSEEAKKLIDNGDTIYNTVRKYEPKPVKEAAESMDEFGFMQV